MSAPTNTPIACPFCGQDLCTDWPEPAVAPDTPPHDEYPPGEYLGGAIAALPPADETVPLQTVEIDAQPLWGHYVVTFEARRNPRRGMGWYWRMYSGRRIAPPRGE